MTFSPLHQLFPPILTSLSLLLPIEQPNICHYCRHDFLTLPFLSSYNHTSILVYTVLLESPYTISQPVLNKCLCSHRLLCYQTGLAVGQRLLPQAALNTQGQIGDRHQCLEYQSKRQNITKQWHMINQYVNKKKRKCLKVYFLWPLGRTVIQKDNNI